MENASKALLIAGGVMLTMLVLSILVYGWGTISEYQAELDRIKEIENTAKFNLQFTNYERNDVLGYELLSLVNKVIDYNQRYSEDGTSTGSAAGNTASFKGITINIQMYENISTTIDHDDDLVTKGDVVDRLTRLIQFPAKIGESKPLPIGDNNNLTLFKEDGYTQSKTINRFKNDVLDIVQVLEEKDSDFGGATGIQNLVKNIDTIYQGNIIEYNDGIADESWYDETYIINRYKTLTGKQTNDMDDIRKEDLAEDVLKYYEYSNFKKAIFECTRVDYDDGEINPDGTIETNTGRVLEMHFRFTDEIK